MIYLYWGIAWFYWGAIVDGMMTDKNAVLYKRVAVYILAPIAIPLVMWLVMLHLGDTLYRWMLP